MGSANLAARGHGEARLPILANSLRHLEPQLPSCTACAQLEHGSFWQLGCVPAKEIAHISSNPAHVRVCPKSEPPGTFHERSPQARARPRSREKTPSCFR